MIRPIAALAFSMILMSAAQAQVSDGFRAPSGNIHCMYSDDPDGTSLRCDIQKTSNPPPRRPRDCDLDWGNAFEVLAKSRRGARICHGDTVADPGLPVLNYGTPWSRGVFSCSISADIGVTCRNGNGAGFELSRARQRVF